MMEIYFFSYWCKYWPYSRSRNLVTVEWNGGSFSFLLIDGFYGFVSSSFFNEISFLIIFQLLFWFSFSLKINIIISSVPLQQWQIQKVIVGVLVIYLHGISRKMDVFLWLLIWKFTNVVTLSILKFVNSLTRFLLKENISRAMVLYKKVCHIDSIMEKQVVFLM